MNITPTIDLLEVVWTVLALVGIVLHSRGWVVHNRQVAYVRNQPSLVEDLDYPLSDRRSEFWRIVKQALFLSVGAMVMTLPPTPAGLGPWRTFVSVWSRFAFISAELIMIYLSAREQVEDAVRVRRRAATIPAQKTVRKRKART